MNFTNGFNENGERPKAYYWCKNPSRGNYYYLIGKHMEGYCLPCCKKIKPNGQVKEIMEVCKNTGKYEG